MREISSSVLMQDGCAKGWEESPQPADGMEGGLREA